MELRQLPKTKKCIFIAAPVTKNRYSWFQPAKLFMKSIKSYCKLSHFIHYCSFFSLNGHCMISSVLLRRNKTASFFPSSVAAFVGALWRHLVVCILHNMLTEPPRFGGEAQGIQTNVAPASSGRMMLTWIESSLTARSPSRGQRNFAATL